MDGVSPSNQSKIIDSFVSVQELVQYALLRGESERSVEFLLQISCAKVKG